jgi:flagellar biosynthesis chaperone FliJ
MLVLYYLHKQTHTQEIGKMKMTNQEIVNTIRELMEKYNEYRTKWVAENGSDEGFDTWFTGQVYNK